MAYLFYPDTDDGRAAAAASDARIAAAPSDGRRRGVRPCGRGPAGRGVRRVPSAGARPGRPTREDHATGPVRERSAGRGHPGFGLGVRCDAAPHGTALLYGDAGHAFLFQHAEHFAATVDLFLR